MCLSVAFLSCCVDPATFRMTQPFNPEQFMLAPRQTTFENLKKDNLLSLGKHLKLDVRKAIRKDVIQHIVMKHLYGVHLRTKIIENKIQFEVQRLDYPCRNLVI